jgi:hypothetical protein
VGEEGAAPGAENVGVTRRRVLRDGSALTLALLVSPPASALGDVAVAVDRRRRSFLSAAEIRTLRGLVDRFIPEDGVGGAVAAGCAEAIDGLLGAFEFDPPRIYAGAPFSDRAGSGKNHFRRFLALDAYEEKGWRLRIRGSRDRKELEFNGPQKGWQSIYREGLRALDAESPGGSFGALSGLERDLVLGNAESPAIGELVDVAFPHTWQFMYGAPEYGGNRDLLGWRYSRYAGDVQPRGWTREEIEAPGQGGPLGGALGVIESILSPQTMLALAPLAAPEAAHHIVARSGGSLSAMRAELEPVLEWARRARDGG